MAALTEMNKEIEDESAKLIEEKLENKPEEVDPEV
jgi:hypothetical protein